MVALEFFFARPVVTASGGDAGSCLWVFCRELQAVQHPPLSLVEFHRNFCSLTHAMALINVIESGPVSGVVVLWC